VSQYIFIVESIGLWAHGGVQKLKYSAAGMSLKTQKRLAFLHLCCFFLNDFWFTVWNKVCS